MQEVADAGEVRILKQQKRKKWWREHWGEVYVWSEMDVGNWEAQTGKGKFDMKPDERKKLLRDEGWSLDIETNWRYMKIHEDTCKKMLRDAGGSFGTKNECRSCWEARGGGNLDMRQEACKKVLRGLEEHVDIEARWPQKIGEREAGGRGGS